MKTKRLEAMGHGWRERFAHGVGHDLALEFIGYGTVAALGGVGYIVYDWLWGD